MSALAESRSIAYSADTAGRAGRIACQVVRSQSVDTGRVGFSIIVRNETSSDAHVAAFVPDTLDLRHRTLVQSVVGSYSDFSTTLELEVARYGGIPDLHVELSGDDISYALIVPRATLNAAANPIAQQPMLATMASANGLAGGASPVAVATPDVYSYAPPRRETLPDDTYVVHPPRPPIVAPAGGKLSPVVEPPRSPAIVPMFAVFTAVMIAVAIAVFRPHIGPLGIPHELQGATNIPIAYRATGIGRLTYHVSGPDGETLANGPLTTGTGAFWIRLPKASESRAYLVRVAMASVFGTTLSEAYVRIPATARAAVAAAPAHRAIPPPQIRSLALDRAEVTGGDTLNVYYDVAATSGSVALVDAASQIAYGKSPLSAAGHTAFTVPVVQTPRFFSVVVRAQRGSATTQSQVGVSATPQSSPTPAADGSTDTTTTAGDVPTAGPVIHVPKSVVSGQPIRVDVAGIVAGMVLSLSDADGTEIARRELGSIQNDTVFTAPIVTAPTRIRLTASYPQGSGSETIVQTIVVVQR